MQSVFEAFLLRSWFKGNDTRAVGVYLEERYRKVILENPDFEHMAYIVTIHSALKAGNAFLRNAYRGHLFLRRPEAKHLAFEGRTLLKQYASAADQAFALQFRRFRLTPKFHMTGHIVLRLEQGCARQPWILSPIAILPNGRGSDRKGLQNFDFLRLKDHPRKYFKEVLGKCPVEHVSDLKD